MNEEEIEAVGRPYYEKEAKNWPSPIGWDNLSYASRLRMAERATGESYLIARYVRPSKR